MKIFYISQKPKAYTATKINEAEIVYVIFAVLENIQRQK